MSRSWRWFDIIYIYIHLSYPMAYLNLPRYAHCKNHPVPCKYPCSSLQSAWLVVSPRHETFERKSDFVPELMGFCSRKPLINLAPIYGIAFRRSSFRSELCVSKLLENMEKYISNQDRCCWGPASQLSHVWNHRVPLLKPTTSKSPVGQPLHLNHKPTRRRQLQRV